ncbi:5' nucleotidase, deoxy (Pyrimidine), cytosolic type C protein (NT5C) [Bordetella pertussis STO1-CHOC-0018]|nr:5' nucleotidase, deoxy (Pyrimidine), cytosolic type C protein (NT5C) [Bordetella pertussis STO1-CHOC-0018]
MLILLDQDGVLADFEHAFIDAWRKRHPDIEPVAFEERKSFHIREDYAPELRGLAEAIYTAPGFIRDLPPVPGAVEAFRELLALGMDVRICSSPLMQFENCVAEKYLWVERHLGRDATQRLILTRDKTLVQGDLLIDDRPVITGAARPRWRHIIYDAPVQPRPDRPAPPGLAQLAQCAGGRTVPLGRLNRPPPAGRKRLFCVSTQHDRIKRQAPAVPRPCACRTRSRRR